MKAESSTVAVQFLWCQHYVLRLQMPPWCNTNGIIFLYIGILVEVCYCCAQKYWAWFDALDSNLEFCMLSIIMFFRQVSLSYAYVGLLFCL